jgi:hypothetical protein
MIINILTNLKIFILILILTSNVYSQRNTPIFNIEPASDHKYFFYYKIYDQSDPGLYFISYDPVKNIYETYDKEFFQQIISNREYSEYNTLLKVNAMNFDMKGNVIPYINPIAAVKLFSVLERLGKDLRITDVFRTHEQQETYKKRRWTSLEISPHQLGLAMDIPPYYLTNAPMIENLCNQLNVRYLVHGSKSNRHLHINDIGMWTNLSPNEVKDISYNISDILPNACCAEMFPIEKGTTTIHLAGNKILNEYRIEAEESSMFSLSITIIDIYMNKAAEIYCGAFGPGKINLSLDMSFLDDGNYFIISKNGQETVNTSYFSVY